MPTEPSVLRPIHGQQIGQNMNFQGIIYVPDCGMTYTINIYKIDNLIEPICTITVDRCQSNPDREGGYATFHLNLPDAGHYLIEIVDSTGKVFPGGIFEIIEVSRGRTDVDKEQTEAHKKPYVQIFNFS